MKRPAKRKNIPAILIKAVEANLVLYTHHADDRIRERRILKREVEYVLKHGHHEARKDKFNSEFKDWDYAIKGKSPDGRNLRIIVAVITPYALIITAIDLDA